MVPVAHIRTPYLEKFGVPRQGNLAPHVQGEIIFEPPFRKPDCVRGLEAFSHIWLIWQFHRNGGSWSPTVRPPRLGGNVRIGVFASRSPFRPNGLGLSAVRLLEIRPGPLLVVSGADLVDGTPIVDIKPYIPYADQIMGASSGFTAKPWEPLHVSVDALLPTGVSKDWLESLRETLAQDPRPAYHDDPQRLYHLSLYPCEVRFRVEGTTAHVVEISRLS